LDITGKVINDGESCIDENNIIYNYFSGQCKESEWNEVKIYQKSKNFNSFVDVTDTLDLISLIKNELIPFFVIYECKYAICSQCNGYIRYKLANNGELTKQESYDYDLVNCYKNKNKDVSNA